MADRKQTDWLEFAMWAAMIAAGVIVLSLVVDATMARYGFGPAFSPQAPAYGNGSEPSQSAPVFVDPDAGYDD